MKNLKLLLFTLIATLFFPIMASAATEMPAADSNGVITLTENVSLSTSYVIEKDKDITIKLNGFNITNTNDTTASDTLYVKLGGKLTIEGEGKITSVKNGYASLFNNGTVVINGGTFEQDGFANRFYVILNHGNMTINNIKVKMLNEDQILSGAHPSLVENGYSNYADHSNQRKGYVENTNQEEPTLVINDGDFDGGLNTVKNDDNAILEINGGTFRNTTQVSLMNWNKATINGGTFETPSGNDKTNIFVGNYGETSVDKGILIINGGTFNAENIVEGSVVTPIEINGGEFNYTKNFINQDNRSNDNLTTEGNIEVVGGIFADDSVEPKDGYTKYSIGNNEYVVASTISFDTKDESITLAVGEEKALKVDELVKKYGKFTSKDESIATVNGGVVKALKEGKTTITVEFNGQTKTINLDVVVSPKTGDNVLMYIIIGIVSVIGLSLCTNNLKKKLS